jgi:hypothetical protein
LSGHEGFELKNDKANPDKRVNSLIQTKSNDGQLMYRIVSLLMVASDSGLGFPLTLIPHTGEYNQNIIRHLKMNGLIEAPKIGTRMTE